MGVSLAPATTHPAFHPTTRDHPGPHKGSLTRSRAMTKVWSQDCLATGPQPVWPTTRLSTFSTASTSPARPESGLRAGQEWGGGLCAPQLPGPPTHWPARLPHAAAWLCSEASPGRGSRPARLQGNVQAPLSAAAHSPGGGPAVSLSGSMVRVHHQMPSSTGSLRPQECCLLMEVANPEPARLTPWQPPATLGADQLVLSSCHPSMSGKKQGHRGRGVRLRPQSSRCQGSGPREHHTRDKSPRGAGCLAGHLFPGPNSAPLPVVGTSAFCQPSGLIFRVTRDLSLRG